MSFNIDEIKTIVKQILHEKIGEKDLQSEHINELNADILTEILNRLQENQYQQQQMKYVVTVLIGKKIDLHTSLACLWDGTTDGCVTVKWENRKIFSIITVFGLGI